MARKKKLSPYAQLISSRIELLRPVLHKIIYGAYSVQNAVEILDESIDDRLSDKELERDVVRLRRTLEDLTESIQELFELPSTANNQQTNS